MSEFEVGDDGALALARRNQAELDGARHDRSQALRRAYEAEDKAAKAQEQNRLLGERLHRLEALVQSAFARSVRTLSSSRGQLGHAVEADKVVQLVEEHLEVTRFLDEQQVPGVKLLPRVRWLQDKATGTIVQENFDFFAGSGDVFGEGKLVEVREDVSVVLFRCKHTKPHPIGGIVDGCGWQGPQEELVGLTGKGGGCCPVCGSPHVRRLSKL